MKALPRSLTRWALENPLFPNHMSFIIGPRQCGKTTLIKNYLNKEKVSLSNYFNFDTEIVRKKFLKNKYFFEDLQKPNKKTPIVFDEIHKRKHWKKFLKGAYDEFHEKFQFVISGSGRLDLFQRGGDSLAGRYDPYFLCPLTPAELEKIAPKDQINLNMLLNIKPIQESTIYDWEHLSGFPEPFLAGSKQKAIRWWSQYKIRVTEEDIRDISKIESIDLVKDLLLILPTKIGSPLSLNSLREDLECSYGTIKLYIKLLNQLFLTFDIRPFFKKINRAIKKEKKLYFFNHLAIDEPALRFENMVALLLKKLCSSLTERAKGEYELFYLRDQDRREIDFLILKNNLPIMLVEAKLNDTIFSPSLYYYHNKLNIPIVQIVRCPNINIQRSEGLVLSIHKLAAICG